ILAGTSAGASAISEVMITSGNDDQAPKKCTVKMAPGLGFLSGVVIDQHFAQRGRTGRLLAAIAQNPHILGIGIDEDTAVVVYPD
ncbi:MAG TPA: cyanophycinase, partial [Clostridiales bacterium]|nr:cyanophycinase [Clostridiales bacterium]